MNGPKKTKTPKPPKPVKPPVLKKDGTPRAKPVRNEFLVAGSIVGKGKGVVAALDMRIAKLQEKLVKLQAERQKAVLAFEEAKTKLLQVA